MMPRFRYKALTEAGALVFGEMEGEDRDAIIARLQELGHFPISAGEPRGMGLRARLAAASRDPRRIGQRELAVATQELGTLLGAGLPLDRALEILVALTEGRRLKEALAGALERVRDGATFADALAADGAAFPPLYVSLVRAGEMGGSLEETLQQLADHLGKSHATREAIKSALIYPTILIGTAALSIIVILVFVLPEFKPLFEGAGKKLPAATRLVMAAGDLVAGYGWAMALAAGAAALLLRQTMRRPEPRRRCHAALLRLPLFGALAAKVETARLGRTLGTLLRNGVTLPVALGIAAGTVSNAAMAAAVTATSQSLREGRGLADLLAGTALFPSLALQLLRVGEETGRLEEMLFRAAEIYERETQRTVERLLALLVPALTVALGAVVAGIIASLLVAILSVNELAF